MKIKQLLPNPDPELQVVIMVEYTNGKAGYQKIPIVCWALVEVEFEDKSNNVWDDEDEFNEYGKTTAVVPLSRWYYELAYFNEVEHESFLGVDGPGHEKPYKSWQYLAETKLALLKARAKQAKEDEAGNDAKADDTVPDTTA